MTKIVKVTIVLLIIAIFHTSVPINAITQDEYIREFEQSLPTDPNEISADLREQMIEDERTNFTTNPPVSFYPDSRLFGVIGLVISAGLAGIAFYIKKRQ